MGTDSTRVDPNGEDVELSVIIGDGVIGDWTVRAHGLNGSNRLWSGTNNDRLPDLVRLPASAAASGELALSWFVVVFGPAEAVSYHVTVDLKQGGRRLCDRPVRLAGTVEARKTTTLSGAFNLVDGVVG